MSVVSQGIQWRLLSFLARVIPALILVPWVDHYGPGPICMTIPALAIPTLYAYKLK